MTEAREKTEYTFPVPLGIQPEEADVLEIRDRPGVGDWAVAKRKLSHKTTRYHGDWTNDYVPYAVPIMEWLSDSGTGQVNVMGCAQSAKTEIGLNFLGHTVDEDPAPFLMVMPRETDAGRRIGARVKPMFEVTPSLRKHLPGGKLDAINLGKETYLDNMNLYIAWAGSPAAMADNPIRKAWADEAGKYPAKVKNEADSLNLIKKRMTTFSGVSKFLNTSTPVVKGDPFDREYAAGLEYFWNVKCVHCGEFHVMSWQHYQLDKDDEGKLLESKVYKNGGHCRYACPVCGALWSEQDRWAANTAGREVPDGCTIDKDGRIIGTEPIAANKSIRITAFMLYPGFMTADILATEWAEAMKAKKAGDLEPLQDFINSRCAESWEETEKETDEDKLRPHIGSYEPRVIPAGCQALTVGFDVQLDHVYFRVDGWGYLSEVWSIDEGRIETGSTLQLENYEPVLRFLQTTYPMASNPDKKMGIWMAGMDSGYRPDVVYDFCRTCRDVVCHPTKGDDSVKKQTFRASKVAGGTQIRYDINVGVFKDRLYRLLFDSQVPGPGYFHLHRDTDDEVLRHLTGEKLIPIRKGKKTEMRWVPKSQHWPNHYWDCDVIASFIADLFGFRRLTDPNEKKEPPKQAHGNVESR